MLDLMLKYIIILIIIYFNNFILIAFGIHFEHAFWALMYIKQLRKRVPDKKETTLKR